MTWKYEEGRYQSEDGSWICFWINKELRGASVDWRVTYEGKTYGSDGMKLKIDHYLDELGAGSLIDDVVGFLDSLKAGCVNQVHLKIGQQSPSQDEESIA